MKKTVVELFAGVGGFRIGLNKIKEINPENNQAIEKKEWDFVWANQWEPSTKIQHAYECYITRFGNKDVSNVDISQVDKRSIPDHNLLVGGFPCQDYSVARTKSNERGIEGRKGVLFWEIAKTIEAKQTPFILLENVDRLLKSPANQRGRDFGIMLRTLSDLGYDAEWRIINAADYGRAQRRRRVFIFAWKRELNYSKKYNNDNTVSFISKESLFAKSFPINEESNAKLKTCDLSAYKDTVEMTLNFSFLFENTGVMINSQVTSLKTFPLIEEAIPLREIIDNTSKADDLVLSLDQYKKFEYLKGGKKIERVKPNGELYFYSEGAMTFLDSLDLPGRTMLTSEGSVNRSTHIIEEPKTGKVRFITPIEAERMQDFPDNWTLTGMPARKRYFMMGNALVTGVISRLEPNLSIIFKEEV